jgi:transposase InsO family protein
MGIPMSATMTKSMQRALTSKWLLVVTEYEKVKAHKSKCFKEVGDLCEAYRVQRKDIRKYYERWIRSGKQEASLMPQPRGPRPGQYRKLSKDEERLLVTIKRRLGASPYEMLEMVKSHIELPPSVRTIYRVFERYPLNERRKKAIKRYEKRYPGELLHADTKWLAKTLCVDRKKRWLFGLLDDCTRLTYVEMLDHMTAAEASQACVRGLKWFRAHGIRAEHVMTDNGVEFTSYTSQKAKETHFFETTLRMFDVQHDYTRPYRPQTNGKIERFWRVLMNECTDAITKGLEYKELEAEILGFVYRYNYQRKHGALAYKTPLEKLQHIADLLPKL